MLNINNKILRYIEENGEENLLKMIDLLESLKVEKEDIEKYLTENVKRIINESKTKKEEENIKLCNDLFEKYIERISNDKNLKSKLECERLLKEVSIEFHEKINKVEIPLNILTTQIESIKESLNYNKNSIVVKGKISENRVSSILIELFPSAEIEDTAHKTAEGDFIIKRDNKKDLLIENKNYSSNVGKQEIDKFVRDVRNGDRNGILLSQNTGISKKENYSIEIIDSNIVMYVHNVNYEKEKIKLAIDVIDSLSDQFMEMTEKGNGEDVRIDKNVLREFENELRRKEKEKSELICAVKKNCNIIIKSIESFEIPKFVIFELKREKSVKKG